MEIYFRNSDIDNYMDVKIAGSHAIGESPIVYKTRMLEENNIPYMLRPVTYEFDNEKWLRYFTSGNYILERALYRFTLDGQLLRLILSQLAECIFSLEKYMLSANDLVVDVRYMTYNADTKSIGIIYVPELNIDIKLQIKNLLEGLMKEFDHRDRTGIVYMYGIYDMLAAGNVSMSRLRDAILYGVENNLTEAFEEEKNCKKQNSRTSCLIPLTNGALEPINFCDYDDVIVVGRGKKDSDYRLPTNQISRVHARIYKKGDRFYVEDNNSTNGTFVNYVKLSAYESKTICAGDIVAFANEEFFVK